MSRHCFFILLFWLAFSNINANDHELQFVENKNQWSSIIDYAVKIPGGEMILQPGHFSYYFIDLEKLENVHERTHGLHNESNGAVNSEEFIQGHTIQVNFINSNPDATPHSLGRLKTYYNYFVGNDPTRWASKAYAYAGVLYSNFFNGIDLKVYSLGGNLKYDYVVAPNADPSQIQVQYDGAEQLYINNGDLYIKTALSEMIEKKPFAFQLINGKKTTVECEYELIGNRLSFRFPKGFDSCYELTIDPLLIFSTYSGSTADNWGSTATPGENGSLYSAGVTNQGSGGKFPTTPGAFQITYGGLYDIAILKYDSIGKQLLYASYLGGSQSESPHSLVMNSNQELIILGTTSSLDFPTTVNAIDRSYNGGTIVSHVVTYTNGSDMFVARISEDGSELLGSTYLGGSGNDGLNVADQGLVKNYGDQLRGDVITDVDGNIYVSSVTSSTNFPLTKGKDTTYNGGATDGLLLKLNMSLTKIIWGTLLGGSKTDAAHTLKLDKDNNIFIAGGTNSTNFPVTANSYKSSLAGAEDGWIAKVASTGDSILKATFTGTSSYDQVYFLDLNDKEDVYVYGQTSGPFPVSAGVYSNPGSGQFVQKFSNDLSTSFFSTVFGSGRGIPDISPTAFLVSECNNLYMSGWGGVVNSEEGFWSSSTFNMPVSSDAFQKTTSGSDFYFISLTDDASQFLYATFLGGTQSRTHVDGGTSRFDKTGIVYHAVCSGCAAFNSSSKATSDFPTTHGAWSRTNNSKNCNNAAFKFDLSVLKARLQTNSANFTMPGLNKICLPDKIGFQNRCIGGETFQWDFGDGGVTSKSDTSRIVYQYKSPGKYKVKLKAIDLQTCIGIDSTYTFVEVFEAKSKVQDDDTICEGTNYVLKASGSATYDWISQDKSFSSSEQEPHVQPSDTTIYYITLTEASGCIRKDTVQLNVIPNLNLDFSLSYDGDCFSRPLIHLHDNTQNKINTDYIFFDLGDGQTSDAQDVVHEYTNDGIYHLAMIGAREFCGFEKRLDVPLYTIKVPNVITPGATPDMNDKFVVQYGEIPGLTPADFGLKVSIKVYNRWGREVYESEDYSYDWGGEGLAAGIYYYDLVIESITTCKGWIQIIK